MGFLQSIWPWSALAVERENVDNWTRTAAGHVGTIEALEKELEELRESKQDLARFMAYFDKLNEELRRKTFEIRALRISMTTYRSREVATEKRIHDQVEELDRLTGVGESLDKENARFAESLLLLQKENEELKSKLSRKGTRRKKDEIRDGITF